MAVPKKPIVGGTVAAAFIALCCSFIAPHEGIKFKAYPDSGGVYSICRGHTKNVHKGDIATKAQCDEYFKEDTTEAVATVEFLTDNAPMPDAVKKVFVDEVFNAGAGNFKKSTMLKRIKAGDLIGACHQFPRWRYVNGKDCTLLSSDCKGIIVRRQEQMDACLKGLK